MYFEDNDLCLRLRRAGWQVYYYPDVAITHLGGQSLRQNPAARGAYQASLRYFYGKHYGPLARRAVTAALWGYNLLARPVVLERRESHAGDR
jgi:GT2 family glycosyltransferase